MKLSVARCRAAIVAIALTAAAFNTGCALDATSPIDEVELQDAAAASPDDEARFVADDQLVTDDLYAEQQLVNDRAITAEDELELDIDDGDPMDDLIGEPELDLPSADPVEQGGLSQEGPQQ